MLNICNMDYANHEKVALAGIIPSLMWFIEEGSVHFLKELALKLFLAMPHSSGKPNILAWNIVNDTRSLLSSTNSASERASLGMRRFPCVHATVAG